MFSLGQVTITQGYLPAQESLRFSFAVTLRPVAQFFAPCNLFQVACCFGSAACTLCCSACGSCNNSVVTRVAYALVLLFGVAVSCVMLAPGLTDQLAKVGI